MRLQESEDKLTDDHRKAKEDTQKSFLSSLIPFKESLADSSKEDRILEETKSKM